jgi:hypothetical protein
LQEAFTVLWWIPAGRTPTLAEAQQKLVRLRERGPSPAAFTFRQPYPSPDSLAEPAPAPFDDRCPA